MVDANVGEAATSLVRGDLERPVQPIKLLLGEVFEVDDIRGNLRISHLRILWKRGTRDVPAHRLFAISQAEYLARPLHRYPALLHQEQQHAFEGLTLGLGAEGLDDFFGQTQVQIHARIVPAEARIR